MRFGFSHNKITVLDIEKSLKFYADALNLKERFRKERPDYTVVFLSDNGLTNHNLEIKWYHNRTKSFDLGENQVHLAMFTDEFEKAHEKHLAMHCIAFNSKTSEAYFIKDPDGYLIEIIPASIR